MSGEPVRRTRWLGALAAVTLVALAGCGGGGGSSSGKSTSQPSTGGAISAPTGPGTLRLKADPSGKLAYNTKRLSAKAGRVTLVMSNPAPLSHDVSIEGAGINKQGKVVGQGGTSTVSATLKPGKYTFYCSVPGHRDAGMFGTLTVK
jgi:uncharacterized cupredoxin-like copper-binding protein